MDRRRATPRHYLMCPPTHFDVVYAINPWMDVSRPVDRALAERQWQDLHDAYRLLGHRVDLLEPAPGLPDMVFAANGALVVDGIAVGARFARPERAAEADHHLQWLRRNGWPTAQPADAVNEGEGDYLVVDDLILAGTGFRSVAAGHGEVMARTGRRVVTLDLVDPRYYHLDTAMCVLDRDTIAWFPGAFSATSAATLRLMFPDAIEVSARDAAVLGCNAVSDGANVVLAAQAEGFAASLAERGFTPIPVDLSEFAKAGGGAKCCTLELRPRASSEVRVEAAAS